MCNERTVKENEKFLNVKADLNRRQLGKAAAGVFATASGGSKPYPMLPYMGILHMASSKELPDFLQGNESAEQALADIEAAYISGAKEKGFL